ncbi:MAG TPA: hypothetical protein VMA74_02560 [Dyella sp.]|uniref:hypothetical protein n=1 Tax=Dyella sp. TaxID=1869338 RepID=UPI002CD197EA|nr:hypothetical protein [Dyella sp.]HUB88590.1 hypothetical protein [Dyella sp.]
MSRSVNVGALLSGMRAAVQWRLLLLWLLVMLIPTALVALPLWTTLGGLLDTSVHSAEWAQGFNDIMFSDVVMQLGDHPESLLTVVVIAQVLSLLLSPFLAGMVVGSGRAGRVLGFGALLQSGLVEYGRMFRVLLWSLVPYAIVVGVHGLGTHLADKHAEQAVLEAQADRYADIAYAVLAIAFVLAQTIVESARAAFIADAGLRSATRALWRGIRQLFKQPLQTLLFYLAVTSAGLLLAAVFGLLRIRVTAVGVGGMLLALLLGQLVVLAIGWMRTARLFVLAEVARVVRPVA